MAYIFHSHPLKDQILQMWDDGKNPYDVEKFLLDKGKEYYISRPTLYKHYNNYKKVGQDKEVKKKRQEAVVFVQRVEKELWDTINAANKKLKDKSLSPKDWQYFDQQKQGAIDKLMKLKELKGTTDDTSLLISKFFTKFLTDQAKVENKDNVTEDSVTKDGVDKDENKVQEVNNENEGEDGQASTTEDNLPGTTL